MATRSLRNRVSSRLSSPMHVTEQEGQAQTQAQTQAEEAVEGRNDDVADPAWLEPPVRRMPPSYQDHKGLERLGVLELQQPLGEPPTQKLLQRLKLNYRPSNRATPLNSEEVVTPSVESERPDFPSPQEAQPSIEPPHESQHFDPMVISSPPRGRPAKKDAAEMRQSGAAAFPFEVTPSPVKSNFEHTPPQRQDSSKPVSIQEHLRQDRVLNYVERAIREAEHNGDLGLVPGLDKLRNDAFVKRDLWAVLDSIAHQEPTEDHLKVFKRFIKKGVKRHRREVLNSGTQNSEATNSLSPRPAPVLAEPFQSQSPSVAAIQPSAFTSPFRTRPSLTQPKTSPRKQKPLPATPSSKRTTVMATNDATSGQRSRSPRKKRSGSQSSSSSLSSAKSVPDDFLARLEAERVSNGADERSPTNGGERQAGVGKTTGNRLRSSNNTNNLPDSRQHPSNFNDVAKLAAKKLKRPREDIDYDPAEIDAQRKHYLADSFQDYNYVSRPEIDERTHVPYHEDEPEVTVSHTRVPPPVVHAHPVQAPLGTLASTTRAPGSLSLELPNGNSRKRRFDEMEEEELDIPTPLSSSPVPDFVPPPPRREALTSCAGTPRAAKHPAVVKARKSARVMVSPNKPKNGGITAGISRAGPGRDSANGHGDDSSAEDNDEFCSSCGGEGKLLCCDGCTRSFHHSCLEPPLDPDEEVDGEWFCPQCLAKRNMNVPETSGLLGKILRRVGDTIPKAFALPFEIREYFDGVRTGDEGEYEEFGQPATQAAPKMNRAGFFEEPNYKEPRDNKGKLITCYKCGLGPSGRDVIPCSFCPARWHLDCCDPPLAVPPRRRVGDKPGGTWRCPLHVEQDLMGIGRQAEAAPGDLGRLTRPRKPKNAKPVDVSLERGFRNNGVIEVGLQKDEMPEIKEISMNGSAFRLPEEGIKLDFIDRVKKSWFEDLTFPLLAGRPRGMQDRSYRPSSGRKHHPSGYVKFKMDEPDFFHGSQALAVAETAKANAAMRRKTFAEQQAVLNLAKLSQKSNGYSGDNVADLTNQLIADAPTPADEAIQRSEKLQLQRLQELIDKRLRILDGVEASPPATTYPTPQPMQTGPRPLKAKPPSQSSYFPPLAPYQSIAPSPPVRTPSMGSNGYQSYASLAPQSGVSPAAASAPSSFSVATPAAIAQAVLDPALDPRLFNGNGDYDDENDGDVEMDSFP